MFASGRTKKRMGEHALIKDINSDAKKKWSIDALSCLARCTLVSRDEQCSAVA